MQYGDYHYLPIAPAPFLFLLALAAGLLILIQLGILRYAYMRLGLSSGAAFLLLAGSLIGSYFNIPIAELPKGPTVTAHIVDFFGMRYVVPVIARSSTIVAINIGGALIPAVMSLYLLIRYRLWVSGAIATIIVAIVIHIFATPVHGVGIAVPVFMPALTTAIVSFLLSREYAPPLAYVSGSLGTLIGADLLNLDKVAGLGAPIASIGGAGTFDGVFLTGILAVLMASIVTPRPRTASW